MTPQLLLIHAEPVGRMIGAGLRDAVRGSLTNTDGLSFTPNYSD